MALDIHDTVSQSLFGIVFTLDGLLKLLPARPEAIKPELEMALEAAESVRHEIRRTIHDLWPEEISAPAFEADLRKYASDTLQANQLMVRFDIRGDFSEMSPAVRRSFYRISQEALTNIVHHAAADEACICVDVANGRASLSVRDNGRGFEPDVALLREYGGEHFGLRGIQKRAQSLGGSCDIFSQPDAGTSIIVDVPVNR
jgi:signal transduction histidine kinase